MASPAVQIVVDALFSTGKYAPHELDARSLETLNSVSARTGRRRRRRRRRRAFKRGRGVALQ
jgi:hypothetical protein